jgi:tRNA A-37 threonylcarbamoyl transferase component Bud32
MSERVGRYEVMEEIGAGGMAVVYKARDPGSGRLVALKQLSSDKLGRKRSMLEALFEREYHTLVRLKHPRIIEVHDYGLHERGPYYTMELLDGGDLQQCAPMPFRDACRHLRDVASSLALIHSHRLVHRDVSPRNVRLTAGGRVKLIDFGALSTFGTSPQVVGTPPSMAPEVLRRLPLDQRTDLYALGALAYWLLTGRNAYPARTVQDLTSLWELAPPLPSQLARDVPPALDALVLALLRGDPLSRPASAAQVIDELTAIAHLEPEEHEQAAASYLSSGPLVGREQEQRWLSERVGRAFAGQGTQILIEGSAGIGRTRLLQEIALQAQLQGAVVLRADALASSRTFGVAVELATALIDALGAPARSAAGESAALLAHLGSDLAAKLETAADAELPDDPGERRAQLQTALHRWFLAVAVQRDLLVAVDNVQAADDNSAAFLAALGHEAHLARLAVVVTQRTGEAVLAPIPVRVLRKRSACLKLAGLGQPACEELVGSLLGHAANTGRLAKLLFDKSGGNPQQCMDLAQLAVKRGIVKYVGGCWVLPLDVDDDELPSRTEELIQEKLAALGPKARALCEALSVHGKRVPIERCLGLCEGMSESDVYRALDELVAEQILLIEDGSYAFRQHALRQSVLEQIDDGRRKSLSHKAARSLLAGDERSVQAQVEAAWHLLHAGAETEGADLMMEAAHVFLQHQGVEDVEQVVRAIETALALYEKQGRSKYEIARLLFPLMSLAFFVDWRVTLKHGERAIDLGLEITGLGLAGRLSRYLPGKLALGLGLAVGFFGFAWQQLRGLKYSLIEAIEGFCGLVPASIGTQNIVFDLPVVQRFTEKLRPLTLFGEKHIASLMFDFANAQYLMSTGREDGAHDLLENLRRDFPDPAIRKVLGEAHWKAMYGGILFSLGCVYPYEFGERSLAIAREMETLGVRVWAMAAEEVRMLHHAFRGEAEAVAQYRERVELFAVQGSTTWQAEIFWPILLLDTEIRSGNTQAVRTIHEQLARRSKDHPTLKVYAEIARATHLTLRGEHARAIPLYERILAELATQDESSAWQAFRACFGFANALNMAGEHARAKRYASELLTRAGKDVRRVVGHYLEPQRQLALAEAGLGNHARAVELLDALLTEHAAEDQPMLIGLLHKARAEVALSMSDAVAFERHFAEMDRRFRAAKSPSMIASAERLAAAAVAAGLRPRPTSLHSELAPGFAVSTATQRAVASVLNATNRAEAALTVIVKGAQARSGHLFLLRDEQLELVAATGGSQPGAAAFERLHNDVLRARHLAHEDESATAVDFVTKVEPAKSVFIDCPLRHELARSGEHELHRVLVLSTRRNDQLVVVGGVILECGQGLVVAVDAELLEPIASALHSQTLAPTTDPRLNELSFARS